MTTSTRRIPKQSLTARVAELEKELASQAKSIELLSQQLRLLRERFVGEFGEDYFSLEVRPREKVMGRPPRISNETLLEKRNDLYTLLHAVQKPLASALREAKSVEELEQLLVERCPARESDNRFQHLIRNRQELWDFMQSDRFSLDLARIANAMAGVPFISFRTSIDRCGKLPPALTVEWLANRCIHL